MKMNTNESSDAGELCQNEFESFFNLIPDLACVASGDGYFRKLNRVWEEKLGYSIDELLTSSIVDFIHPEDIALTKQEVRKKLSRNTTIEFTNRYRCKDGSYRWLEWRATPAKDGRLFAVARDVTEQRRAEELQTANYELETRVSERTAELARANELLRIDISERKKTEEALWKSESILRKIFEAVPDMVSVIDRDLRIVHSNWQGGYKYVDDALRNDTPNCYDAFYPGQGKPCDECHVLEVFRTGEPVTREKLNPRIGLVEIRAFPILDDAGAVVLVAEYIRDITEHRHLEDESRRSQKLESLGVLAGGIAHDFNNLLTGILGNVSMTKLAMNPEDKGYAGLDSAAKAALRARDLTQQLLTFSKGGAPVKKTASIEELVRDSASFVLRGSNVRCEFIIPEALWPVEVDEGQISQVMNNLIINADQAMPEGGIIEVRIDNVIIGSNERIATKEGRYVKISIKDHGVGITKEHLQKIFDPYFTTKQRGSGLGLTTVYSIIKSHDGFIKVYSMVGEGTAFHVSLPASDKELLERNCTEEKTVSGSGKILVMDDEELIREVASGMLGHFGFEAEVCNEGTEAVRLYGEAKQAGTPFAAVLMDLTIPGGMGGKETMKKLLEIDPKAVGIVSSGYCNDPILAHYRDYGFRGVVTKPYNIEELSAVLHDLL